MYDARNSLRPFLLGAVLVAVSVGGATLAGCSGDAASDPPTTGGSSSPSEPAPGTAQDGTPAKSTTGSGGASAAPTGASPAGGSDGGSSPGTDAGAAPGQDSGTTTPTAKQLGETCAQNSDCKSAECFVGGMGSYCSLLCTPGNAATVCVAPFSGVCNNKGYCKK